MNCSKPSYFNNFLGTNSTTFINSPTEIITGLIKYIQTNETIGTTIPQSCGPAVALFVKLLLFHFTTGYVNFIMLSIYSVCVFIFQLYQLVIFDGDCLVILATCMLNRINIINFQYFSGYI